MIDFVRLKCSYPCPLPPRPQMILQRTKTYAVCAWLVAFAILTPISAFAASDSSTKIAEIRIYDDGHAVIRFTDLTAQTLCGSWYYSLGLATDPKQKAMLSVATAAMLAGKNVSVVTSGTTGAGCQGAEEKVTQLALIP